VFRVTDAGGALVYMAEDAAPIIKARLAGLCRHRALTLGALPIGVIRVPSLRLDRPPDQRRLAETVRREAPRLLVLDPFVRLHRINENQAGEVAAILGYLRELQRAHDLAVLVVHHARKNGGATTGGQSLRGSSDFFAWVDTALSLRRRHHHVALAIEHRAAAAADPVTLALVGTEQDMHLAIVSATEPPGQAAPVPADLDGAILDSLDHAGVAGMPRAALRASLRVRNERLGAALTRLATSGAIARRGEAWVRLPGPVPPRTETLRNGNGNARRPDD
jgi:hypothetical protein